MKAVIIEDELAAAKALETLLRETAPDIEVAAVIQSIEEGVEWFGTHPPPDLAFVDIHLADGSSFSIFEGVEVSCPVIFTTAYDQYAIRAFTVNSVDYLLKPVDGARLERALKKFRSLKGSGQGPENRQLMERLIAEMHRTARYKSALLVASGDKLTPLPVKSIAYIYTAEKIVRAVDLTGREITVDQSLDELCSQLDPQRFYRANRQYIVARNAVRDISLWFNGRLSLNLTVKTPERVFVSRANAPGFKRWMTS